MIPVAPSHQPVMPAAPSVTPVALLHSPVMPIALLHLSVLRTYSNTLSDIYNNTTPLGVIYSNATMHIDVNDDEWGLEENIESKKEPKVVDPYLTHSEFEENCLLGWI